jgi:hypothetical protein
MPNTFPEPPYIKFFERFKAAAETFASSGWFVPAYLRLGIVMDLAEKLSNAPSDERGTLLSEELPRLYRPLEIATMLRRRYRVCPVIRDYGDMIEQSIEAYYAGFREPAIAGLVHAVEGILRGYASTKGDVSHKPSKVVRDSIAGLRASMKGPRWDPEREVMLASFERFIVERMWSDHTMLPAGETLNRNGIAHAILGGSEFATAGNFARLISILDFLTFLFICEGLAIEERLGGLAPDSEPIDIATGQYYASMGDIFGVAKSVVRRVGLQVAAPESGDAVTDHASADGAKGSADG